MQHARKAFFLCVSLQFPLSLFLLDHNLREDVEALLMFGLLQENKPCGGRLQGGNVMLSSLQPRHTYTYTGPHRDVYAARCYLKEHQFLLKMIVLQLGANSHDETCNHYRLGVRYRLEEPSCAWKATGWKSITDNLIYFLLIIEYRKRKHQRQDWKNKWRFSQYSLMIMQTPFLLPAQHLYLWYIIVVM